MAKLKIAVQMDPIDTMLVDRDTSLVLMLEAQNRGHEVYWFHPNDLFFDRGWNIHPVTLPARREAEDSQFLRNVRRDGVAV